MFKLNVQTGTIQNVLGWTVASINLWHFYVITAKIIQYDAFIDIYKMLLSFPLLRLSHAKTVPYNIFE